MLLNTPGSIVRRVIRDMRLHPQLWTRDTMYGPLRRTIHDCRMVRVGVNDEQRWSAWLGLYRIVEENKYEPLAVLDLGMWHSLRLLTAIRRRVAKDFSGVL